MFSSGRVVNTNGGIVGLDGRMDVYHGFDGSVYTNGSALYDQDDPEYDRTQGEGWYLSKEDLAELADFMIRRWTAFRKMVG